jgi:EAL domain-containing protein (putative c-di-GMP-specific phosphodiesterase class I)
MAHALGCFVVAEGIETPAQHRLLMALGCDCGQGFLLGRPAPAAGLEAARVAAMTTTEPTTEPA